jgi:hypothetical protein
MAGVAVDNAVQMAEENFRSLFPDSTFLPSRESEDANEDDEGANNARDLAEEAVELEQNATVSRVPTQHRERNDNEIALFDYQGSMNVVGGFK